LQSPNLLVYFSWQHRIPQCTHRVCSGDDDRCCGSTRGQPVSPCTCLPMHVCRPSHSLPSPHAICMTVGQPKAAAVLLPSLSQPDAAAQLLQARHWLRRHAKP
jgi:hypothetical protein